MALARLASLAFRPVSTSTSSDRTDHAANACIRLNTAMRAGMALRVLNARPPAGVFQPPAPRRPIQFPTQSADDNPRRGG